MRTGIRIMLAAVLSACAIAHAAPIRIGAEALVPENPRSAYSRYVNWRPGDGETVDLNPPRFSWPYRADWPQQWGDATHLFTFQISAEPDCSRPVVDVTCGYNFYNTIPELEAGRRYYWRVGYDIGTQAEKWSDIRSFTIAEDALVWDRSALAEGNLSMPAHPRVCLNAEKIDAIRALAVTDEGSAAALAHMVTQADTIMKKDWWADFPQSDRLEQPKQAFYTIAGDLATVAFVWKITQDERYAGVLERAVTWASYPPGGRASPEGLGGDGAEDATQGNEFLALLFDWLYQDMTQDQRDVVIQSLEWRTDHIMNSFSFRSRGSNGTMLRLTFKSDAKEIAFEAEDCTLLGGAKVIDHEKAQGGKLVQFAAKDAAISRMVTLKPGPYSVNVRGYGPAGDQDGFFVQLGELTPQRLFISEWGSQSASFTLKEEGEYELRVLADPNEIGMTIDAISVAVHGDQRLRLTPSDDWKEFTWQLPVPPGATSLVVEGFNYYARGETWWDSIRVIPRGRKSNLLSNGDFTDAAGDRPAGWRGQQYGTASELRYSADGGRDGSGALGIICPGDADRGAWGQTIEVGDATVLDVTGWYRTSGQVSGGPAKMGGMAGCISSHAFESAMDTAVCGLVLYEHSAVGKEWFEICLNYLIAVTVGHGFDEGWNEGAGYGTSKNKWLTNASLYYDTALPDAHLGRNPRYGTLGDWFCRIIPVGMSHHAWGNQANASRGNHVAAFRKMAYLTGDGRLISNWREYGGDKFSPWRAWIEYVLPAHYAEPEPTQDARLARCFPVDGWVMAASGPPGLRSTYEQGAGVIFQCRPRGGYSHSFNSDGSFQLHAYGQMLNHGGGTSANLDAYAYHTMSHNTILVDGLGQAQPSSGMTYPTYGRIVGFQESDGLVYMAGDVTRCYPKEPGNYRRWGLPLDEVYAARALPYLERFIRHILFVDGSYFVVYDDLRCSQPARYTWMYHILPDSPVTFDANTFAVDYTAGDVPVRLQHIYRPEALELDNRKGEDGLVNPFTGEDYRALRKGDILCGHNLWITNREPSEEWHFLSVVYPQPSGGEIPAIERIDDNTVRVGEKTICFDPSAPSAAAADILVDVTQFR